MVGISWNRESYDGIVIIIRKDKGMGIPSNPKGLAIFFELKQLL